MNNFDIRSLIPHGLAILAFMLISASIFHPEFKGKKLNQSDIIQYRGMSKEIVDYREATGEEALWTNQMFGGMPAYQISVRYPNPVLKPVDTVMRLFVKGGFGIVFLYMICFYILCIALKLDPWLGVLGAIAFGLSSYHLIILEAGHNTKALAIGYLPGVVAGFVLIFKRKKYVLGGAITALFLGLELMCNHPQITYYLLITLLLLGVAILVDAIVNKEVKSLATGLGVFLLASILALGTSSSRLLNTAEYSPSTIRGPSELSVKDSDNMTSGLNKDYATAWSYGIGESFTLLVPNFNGGASGLMGQEKDALKGIKGQNKRIIAENTNRYWGDQTFTSGPVYLGAIICLLALLGMWFVKGPMKYGLIAAAILTLMLSWGKNYMPLTNWFLDNFPLYNKFRAVSMTLVVIEFVFPFLAVLGLHEITKRREEIQKSAIPFYALNAGLVLLLVFMLLSPTTFTSFHSNVSPSPEMNEIEFLESQLTQAGMAPKQAFNVVEDLLEARKSLFTSDVKRSLIFVFLAAALLILFVRGAIDKKVLWPSLILLILIDLWSVDKRYVNEENFVSKKKMEHPIPESPADKSIAQDKDPHYRVLNTTTRLDRDGRTSYYHKSLGGYHGAKLRRYQDVIDQHLNKSNRKVMDMLNTKYVIVADEQRRLSAQQNPSALGNCWFVEKITSVNSPDEEIAALTTFEPASEAVIDISRMGEVTTSAGSPSDKIELSVYDPKNMEYISNCSSDRYAVFSEIYYQPGWNAYIDNEPVEHQRVNYILRGLKIPAGEHQVDFRFEPSTYKMGNIIVYLSSFLLLAMLVFSTYTTLKKSDKDSAPALDQA